MDIEKAGCYKLYRCRSLLACDSGGTVYDTSQRLEDSDGESFYKNADESQSESGQSENIIYIIGNHDRVKSSNSPTSQQSLTDPNTQLDDDEFKQYEPYSYVSNNGSQCDLVQYVKEEGVIEDENCKYYIVQCNDIDSTQNSATETVDSDSFDRENFEHYSDSINLNSSVEDTSVNSNTNDAVSGNSFIYNQDEAQLLNLSNFSQETARSIDSQDVTDSENHSPLKPEIDSTTKHSRKRKQTYKVKSDSFAELLEEGESSDASSVSDISKKSRPACRKDNQKRKLQFEKSDPFENLKMSSILKKDHYVEDQLKSKDCWRESLVSSNDENSEPSTASSNDEEASNSERSDRSRYSSYFPSGNFFQNLDAYSIKLNADLTNADYLEYVQPREKIVESNMDKLLSPTIEVGISTIMNHYKIEQHVQAQVDCNGNEDNLKDNSSSKISANEVVEKQLVSKAAYAREHGIPNLFDTSNECVVDEILFDRLCAYREVELETNWISIRNNFQPKVPLVLLENNDPCLTQHQQLNDPFKSVSCSLKETLNDFDKFGEFSADNSNQEEKTSQTKEIINEVQKIETTGVCATSNAVKKPDECSQLKIQESRNTFKSSSGPNSLVPDVNANYDSSKIVSSSSTCETQPIAPLKLRIKRISDDNQYVIDDSSTFKYPPNDAKSSKFQKNPDSKYECFSCSETFRTKKLLKSHISENHNGPYDSECEICGMKSKKSSAHKKHHPNCERSTKVKCEVCNKEYCYKAVLERHMSKVHKR